MNILSTTVREYYMESELLTTATGQIVYELTAMFISGVVGIVGYYAKSWLKQNSVVQEYGLYNTSVERILDNAIGYAESKGKSLAMSGIEKRKMAFSYIEMVSPEVISKEGDKLEMMIDRKVAQRFGKM